MDISEKQAVWNIERPQFEASFIHSFWLNSFDFNDKTGDYEVKPELAGDAYSKLAYEVLNTGWVMWLRAKKQAAPDGLVLVEKSKTERWYLDESEGLYMDDPDYWLCDLDIGEVQAVQHKEYLVTQSNILYATKVWDDKNGDIDSWQFFESQDEAEKAAAHCKAKFLE